MNFSVLESKDRIEIKKAFFSYGSAIPKRTPRYITLSLSMK